MAESTVYVEVFAFADGVKAAMVFAIFHGHGQRANHRPADLAAVRVA